MTMSVEYHQSISKKPMYLVSLSDKTKTNFFITLDRPSFGNGFIETKGFFIDAEIDVITKNFLDLAAEVQKDRKEDLIEVMFPLQKINFIRNLFYKAK
jgi:hypothetical protein